MKAYLAAAVALVGSLALGSASADPVLDARILSVAQAWDHAQFEMTDNVAKLAELQRVETTAAQLAAQYPQQAEPLVWQAITVSSEAGVRGGLGGLSLATRARDLLEQAEHINPNAMGDGSVYTSLGSLYAQVPGFPIGFGNRDRARQYLQRALSASPNGIDSNYFMADFLVRQGDYASAIVHLRRAVSAPPRPGREVGDRGRQRDVAALLRQAEARAR